MKKIFALALVLALSACACWESTSEEPEVVYQNVQERPQNCDYFDGKTCYRYVRRVRQAPVLRYREPAVPPCGCGVKASCPTTSCCGCTAPQVKETREPVEVVYKKTTYKTVCDPQTTATVSYERAPYSQEVATTTSETEVAAE